MPGAAAAGARAAAGAARRRDVHPGLHRPGRVRRGGLCVCVCVGGGLGGECVRGCVRGCVCVRVSVLLCFWTKRPEKSALLQQLKKNAFVTNLCPSFVQRECFVLRFRCSVTRRPGTVGA